MALLAGCSTPNPNPGATTGAYEQVKPGMSREQVFALMGTPRTFRPSGDVNRCESATWSIPHDSRGVGHWTVHFTGDTVDSIGNAFATVSFHWNATASGPANGSK